MRKSFYFFASAFVCSMWTCRVNPSATNRPRILGMLQGKACRLINEYIETVRQSPGYEIKKAEIVKYNRSTSIPVINYEFLLHDEKSTNYMVWIDGYEKLGMEHIYKRSAISIHVTTCDIISGAFLLSNSLKNFSNIPKKCPLKKDHLYYLHNFFLEDNATPPTFPGYKWRFDIQIGPEGKKDTNKTALLRYYLRVEWYDRKKGSTVPTP